MYHGTGLTSEDVTAAFAALSMVGDPDLQLAVALQGMCAQPSYFIADI